MSTLSPRSIGRAKSGACGSPPILCRDRSRWTRCSITSSSSRGRRATRNDAPRRGCQADRDVPSGASVLVGVAAGHERGERLRAVYCDGGRRYPYVISISTRAGIKRAKFREDGRGVVIKITRTAIEDRPRAEAQGARHRDFEMQITASDFARLCAKLLPQAPRCPRHRTRPRGRDVRRRAKLGISPTPQPRARGQTAMVVEPEAERVGHIPSAAARIAELEAENGKLRDLVRFLEQSRPR